MGACPCALGTKNSGITSKQQVAAAVVKDVYVPLFKADGTKNYIDLAASLVDGVLPEQFFLDQVAKDDPTERWYPTPKTFTTVTPAQADARAQTFGDGSIAIAGKGIKSVLYQIPKVEPVWGGKIEDLSCDEIGTYTIDECGGIEGVVVAGDENLLYPKPINKDSFDVNNIPGDFSPVVETVQITYQFKLKYQDRDRRYINPAAVGTDLLELYALGGLLDIVPVITLVTATGFTLEANTCFNYPEQVKAVGLLATYFALVDGVTPVVITSADEQAGNPGFYDFVFASTPATTLTLSRTALMTDAGFDMADQSIVTP